jgi:hypothetical protein
MSRRRPRVPSSCKDCDIRVYSIGHWYMVENEVWALTGLGRETGDGVLCLDRLERRIGRPLVYEDFKSTVAPAGAASAWCRGRGANTVSAGSGRRRDCPQRPRRAPRRS